MDACELLITADDRTGALESGGACADLGFDVRLAKAPVAGDECLVVDIASRHVSAELAAQRILSGHAASARHRCHKMDSGLRGNWHFEVAALVEAGWRVGVLASYPAAGRRCRQGTVFIHDVPVADSPFGRDPRSPLVSSRPADYLRLAGCEQSLARGDVVVLDADDDAELADAAALCKAERRLLVGATGAIAAYAALLRDANSEEARPAPVLPRPALIVCGSLHPLSREQIARAPCLQTILPGDERAALQALGAGHDVVLASPTQNNPIDDASAERIAAQLAETAWDWQRRADTAALVVFGGDTALAILGNRALRLEGSVDTGIPLCRTDDGLRVVTKGGGIGDEDALKRLLDRGTKTA